MQNSDLSLLEILQSLQNKSGSFREISDPPLSCTSTASLFDTTTSTNTVEDTIRIIEENISVTWEQPITRTDNNGRLKSYFCSDFVFNLSHKVLTHLEISVLEKRTRFFTLTYVYKRTVGGSLPILLEK